ncbi:MAG: type II toxin-antitoxin system VapC family toxin [Verrucomicrobia bacterium]|nr:type II toxin-antitoxin system VapC family toxin [Verrucomicrobiota bacterium]
MLTDTTFWIDLLQERRDRRRGPASQFLASHRAQALEVSIITWGELASGFNSPDALDHLLRKVRILNLHLQVAWEAGRIERELAEQGTRLGENDNWIAATARVWGLRLVSRDAAFERVVGITVVRY